MGDDDSLPGLVVDKYEDHLVVQTHYLGMDMRYISFVKFKY